MKPSCKKERQELAPREKRVKMEKRREDIRSGIATPEWPSHWNLPDSIQQRWFVLTNDAFPTHNPGTSDIKIRPHTLLEHMLPPRSSAQQLAALLDDPPTPPVQMYLRERYRFGALTIYVETPDTRGFPTQGEVAPPDQGRKTYLPKVKSPLSQK